MPITLPPINRRHFLTGTLSCLAVTWFSSAFGAEFESSSQDVWAMLSDVHIPGDRNKRDPNKRSPRDKTSGILPVEHLQKIRADVLSNEAGKPSGVIVSGDCAYLNGLPDDYQTLLEEFAPFQKAGLPVHFVMGNHDSREAFLNAIAKKTGQKPPQIPNRLHSIVETPKANFFLLDSVTENTFKALGGRLGEDQLQWLTDELDSHKDKPALLVAHHHPNDDNVTKWSNPFLGASNSLLDTTAFFNVIRNRKQVKAYFYGHTHAWETRNADGIKMVNIPTTAWHFDEKQPYAWILLKLKDNGASLTVRSIDSEHPKHNETIDLTWR
jgi:3',5'-cyclic AMP phosphodiesterase CpdA